ncbi:hypothetical protein BJP06_06435 [Corynebacterium sp. NML120713]|nr:hypothetical protein BJP06_06435 [Corynebacterium sp. NML120713]
MDSPFSKLMRGLTKFGEEVLGWVADGIRGEGGAKSTVIAGAVNERLGPINTAISEAGEHVTDLGLKVEQNSRKQRELQDQTKNVLSQTNNAVLQAKQATTNVANYKKAQDDLARKYANESKQLQNKLSGIVTEQDGINDQIKMVMGEVDRFAAGTAMLNENLRKISDEQGNLTTKAKKQMETVVEANKKVKSAVDEADKAFKAIEGMVDIGASLVALIPGTDTPDWSRAASNTGKMPDPPTNVKGVYACNANQKQTMVPNPRKVKAIAGRWYTYEFWVRSNKANAALLIRLNDGDRHRAAIKQFKPKDNPGQWTTTVWGIGGGIKVTKANEWQKFSGRLQLQDDIEYVALDRMEWKWGGKGPQDAVIYVAGLKVLPEVPDQATVDRLQNNAILKNTAVGKSNAKAIDVLVEARDLQLKWNDQQQGWNATQEKLNATNKDAINGLKKANKLQQDWNREQKNWNKTANTAMSANTSAIIALARKDSAQSILAWKDLTEAEVKAGKREVWKPVWATGAIWYREKKTASDGDKRFLGNHDDMWGVSSTTSTRNCETAWMRVEPGKRYKLSFWARGTRAGSRLYIQMWGKGSNGGSPFRKVWYNVDSKTGQRTESRGSWTSYPVQNYELSTTWKLFEQVVEIREGVTELRFGKFYWNHSNGTAKANQWITGLEFGPDIPLQKDVDEAQSLGIELNKRANELDEEFRLAQMKTNNLIQAQLWNHLDMIEFLDIRTPKVYGWGAKFASSQKFNYPNPYNRNRGGYYITAPYHEQWLHYDDKEFFVACRGTWVGKIEVQINWTNGAIDNWTEYVEPNQRIFKYTGGAPTIKMRHASVTVYVESLKRECSTRLGTKHRDDKYPNQTGNEKLPRKMWTGQLDTNGLIRKCEKGFLRLKNTVTCNRDVVVRDEEFKPKTIKAGKPLRAYTIYPEDQKLASGTQYTFKEVVSPVVGTPAEGGYTIPDGRPRGTVKVSKAS